GIAHHYARLAMVDVAGGVFVVNSNFKDCRKRLPALTSLNSDDIAFQGTPSFPLSRIPSGINTVTSVLEILGQNQTPLASNIPFTSTQACFTGSPPGTIANALDALCNRILGLTASNIGFTGTTNFQPPPSPPTVNAALDAVGVRFATVNTSIANLTSSQVAFPGSTNLPAPVPATVFAALDGIGLRLTTTEQFKAPISLIGRHTGGVSPASFFTPGLISFANPPATNTTTAPRLALGPRVIRRVRVLVNQNSLQSASSTPAAFQIAVTPGAGSSTLPLAATTFANVALTPTGVGDGLGLQTILNGVFPIFLTAGNDEVNISIIGGTTATGSLLATIFVELLDQ